MKHLECRNINKYYANYTYLPKHYVNFITKTKAKDDAKKALEAKQLLLKGNTISGIQDLDFSSKNSIERLPKTQIDNQPPSISANVFNWLPNPVP